MNALDSVLGWLAIGAAASLAALAWPFMRGSAAVIIKMLLGPLGAVLGALISHVLLPREPAIARLLFAAVGAIVVLVITQIVWQRYSRSKRLAT